ncbi:unnamed protein product [Agarophyton chilense]
MAHDVYTFVGQCESCVRTRGGIRKHRKYLMLFPAAGPLEFVAIDLIGPLSKNKNGYQHILVITDRFSKLTRAIPLKGYEFNYAGDRVPQQLGLPVWCTTVPTYR